MLKYYGMKKTIEVFGSFADAEQGDKEYYRSLTPKQRVDMLLEPIDQSAPWKPDGTRQGIKRVARIVELSDLKESD